MLRYFSIDLKWSLKNLNQWRSLVYRIYINIFGIFFRIKLLPLAIDKWGIDFYYKGDTIIWVSPWKRKEKDKVWISVLASGNGDFGSVYFSSLREMDKFWDECDVAFSEKKL